MSTSQFNQNVITAVCTLFVVSLGFCLLEQYLFSYQRQTVVREVPVPAPVLTPIVTSPSAFPPAVKKFPVFMVYQQNLTMLQHAFDSAQEAFPGQVVIIDNSPTLNLSTNPDFKAAAAVWHTAVYLSFPQFHNLMAAMAAAWGFGVYAWMHSDAVVLKNTEEDLGELLLQALRPFGSEWSVAFTTYDILAFYNTRVVLKEPWDEDFLQNYITDCDAYNRWQKEGHKLVELLLGSQGKHMRVIHLADAPSNRWGKMTASQRWQVYPRLEKAKYRSGSSANQWKWNSKSEKRAMSTQKHRFEAAQKYYMDKWNTSDCNVSKTARPFFDVPPSVMYWAAVHQDRVEDELGS